MLKEIGLLGGILIIVADTPYAWNAFKRKTKPHRTTWFIIALINAINLANQHASGAKSSLLFFIGATAITFIVFLASLYNGTGGFAKLDIVVLIGALLGLIIWHVLQSPVASVIAVGKLDFALLLFPTYATLQQAALFALIEVRERQLKA
jgi:hypothetical protein